jgi:erythromycin esterase-like protein
MTVSLTALVPDRPHLLALGEPTHGDNALLRVRNELIRDLVEHDGYRTITIESDCLAGLLVDDYVTGADGDLDEVMARGFSHDWGAFGGNRDLVRWMRSHNQQRPESEQVRFAGFDGPLEITGARSPRAALIGLFAFLAARVEATLLPCTMDTLDELLGDDDRWPDQAAMMDPSRSIGRTPQAAALRLHTDELAAALTAHTPHLMSTSTPREWERAHLYARTAAGLLRYHHWMADTSPSRMARLLSARDAIMAGNLLALRGPVIAYGHNAHLQRTRSSMSFGGPPVSWWGAGSIVSAVLGDRYAVLAGAIGTLRAHGIGTPEPDTIESRLYARGPSPFAVDPRELTATTARVSPWFGYAPLDPAEVARFDGVVFVPDC